MHASLVPGPDAEIQRRLQVVLDRYVVQCARALFATHSVDLGDSAPDDANRELTSYSAAGVIGLVGDLSGTLLLGCDASLIEASHPLRATQARLSTYERFDWIGELTNQMAGRLKSRLTSYGLTFEFSPPISVAGDRLRFLPATGHTHRSSFQSPASRLGVWIDVAMSDAIGARPEFFTDHETRAVEGTVILF